MIYYLEGVDIMNGVDSHESIHFDVDLVGHMSTKLTSKQVGSKE